MTNPSTQSIEAAKDCINSSLILINQGKSEQAVRDNFTSFLRKIFPDEPSWIARHVSGSETSVAVLKGGNSSNGLVDNLVDLTAIEYEQNLLQRRKYEDGLRQLKEYCSSLINQGNSPDKVIGILSDTVRWYAFAVEVSNPSISLPISPGEIILHELESIDTSPANNYAASLLITFLNHYLGRLESRLLNANTISADLGFDSPFSRRTLPNINRLVQRAFSDRPKYADLIKSLWSNFVSYLNTKFSSLAFDINSYISEFYILTLAKLICANIVERRVLLSDESGIISILNGNFFKERGLANLVEYDYFGWLNGQPYINEMISIAQLIQQDLQAYDFQKAPQEDLFGQLMAQLSNRTQRALLGQEWTPAWLARQIVAHTVALLPKGEKPRFIDMCCGSGVMLAEVIRLLSDELKNQPNMDKDTVISTLLDSITGFDIDPLAILLAKITWVVAARDYLENLSHPINIPVYHADSLFAISPLSQNLLADEERGSFHLDIAGEQISLPHYLLNSQHPGLFDTLLDNVYSLALATEKPSQQLITDIVIHALSENNVELLSDQFNEILRSTKDLTERIATLNREGRNGIWTFILRNSYRPSLVAGNFNGVVSNPPWLAMSKFSNNPYKKILSTKSERYNIKPVGSSHLHIELSTTFLIHAVDRYLHDGAVVGCIVPETILNGHHHNRFRQGAFRQGTHPVNFFIQEIWQVEPGTFKNKAAVLFGVKGENDPAIFPITGLVVSKGLNQQVKFYLNSQGNRTIWSRNYQSPTSNSGFFKPADFKQGADIMPRKLFFMDIATSPSANQGQIEVTSIDSSTSSYWYVVSEAKKYQSFKFPRKQVHSSFIFDVLTSNLLTPFAINQTVIPKALLPLRKKNDNSWEILETLSILAIHRNTYQAFTQIEQAIGSEDKNKTINSRIDCRGKLSQQTILPEGYIIVTGAGGETPCAAFMPIDEMVVKKLVIDQTLYWAQVDTEDEAIYLVGLFNSDAINEVIRDFVPQGEFGGRHLHKLPFGVTPPYDSTNTAHQDVVDKTRNLLNEFNDKKSDSEKVKSALDPNSSLLSRRRSIIRGFLCGLDSYPSYETSCRALYGL